MAAGLFRVSELGKKGWEGRREERKRGGGARWKLQCFYNLIAKITCYLCSILLVTQTNPGPVWGWTTSCESGDGTHWGDLGDS